MTNTKSAARLAIVMTIGTCGAVAPLLGVKS